MSTLTELATLLISAGFPQNIEFIAREFFRRIYSNELTYGFYFDLTDKFNLPQLKIPLTVREIKESDIAQLSNFKEYGSSCEELKKLIELILFSRSGIGTCHVVVTQNDAPCGMCWLIDHTDNAYLQAYFKNGILDLKPREVLCEFIYVLPEYRGNNVMAFLTLKLFTIALESGAQRAIAYVKDTNTVSKRVSADKIGWKPFVVKKVSWRMFRRHITFIDTAEKVPASL